MDLIRIMLVMWLLVVLRVVMLMGLIASACMIERACVKGLSTR
jgi:hypothetical protein